MYHFKTKENLFLCLVELWDKEWIYIYNKIDKNNITASDKLRSLAEECIKSDLTHPLRKAYLEYIGTITNSPLNYREKINDDISIYKETYKKILLEGVVSKEFKEIDIDLYADIIHGCINGILESFNNYDVERLTKILLEALDIFLESISTNS